MNTKLKKISLLALTFAMSLVINAQSVGELCRLHVEKLGGKVAVEKVKSLKITQVGTSQGGNMPMTTILVPGKSYYQKVRNGIGIFITCAHENKGWTYMTTPVPKSAEIPDNMVKSLMIDSKYYGPLYDYYVNSAKSDVSTITIMGHTLIDREKCYKLLVTYKSGYKSTVYLSSRNYMIKKVESVLGIIRYSNYKKTSNIMIPRYVEMSNNNGTITSVVSKVEINSKIDNGLFLCP